MELTSQDFKAKAKKALKDESLQVAMKRAMGTFVAKRKTAIGELEDDFEPLRNYCAAVKDHTIKHLDHYLEQFIEQLEALGATVHFAADGAEANSIISTLALEKGVRKAVKSKSMVSEEIKLNEALESAGVIPIETDLGEYILQIDNDYPSHIIGPAIHKTKEQIAALFHEKLGSAKDADPVALTAVARKKLRQDFFDADMGITGVNFAVAETGTLVMVENEGNIRFSNSLPRIHVALMGIEKIVPRLRDLPAFLTLLPRSATGQKSSSYVSLITGAKRETDPHGPEELHVVILDNGRSSVLADAKMRDALRCIRCSACLNACPVYLNVGGHAYGWVYPGPIGAILDPGLVGLEQTKLLPQASSLCGACAEVCPVKIPIPDLLLEHRVRSVERGLNMNVEKAGIGAFAFMANKPTLWDMNTKVARFGAQFLSQDGFVNGNWLPVLKEWLRERDMRTPAKVSFKERWRKELKGQKASTAYRQPDPKAQKPKEEKPKEENHD